MFSPYIPLPAVDPAIVPTPQQNAFSLSEALSPFPRRGPTH
jgi:hypothetical protein